MAVGEDDNAGDRGLDHGIRQLGFRTRDGLPGAFQLRFCNLVFGLGFVEILVFIEKKFKLPLIASDLTKKDFESIRSLASYLSRKLQ